MHYEDYYELLGVDPSATVEEIKKAYRRLAHQFHPDKNPHDPKAAEKFRRLTEAYQTLQDAQKRAAYDYYGGKNQEPFYQKFPDFEDFAPPRVFFDNFWDDFFEEFLGRPKFRSFHNRGANLRYNLEVSLEEAAWGAEKEIKILGHIICPDCQGKRSAQGTMPRVCPICHGRGIWQGQRGFFQTETACYRCAGEGQIITHPCPKCQGSGRIKSTKLIRLRIPPGVDNGSCLRLPQAGEAGRNGGQYGDLYIFINLKKHDFFTRLGGDLLCEMPISPTQAKKGGEIEVPTLRGKVKIKIPPGTRTGKIFTLKGEGMPILGRKGRGDQKIKIFIKAPL